MPKSPTEPNRSAKRAGKNPRQPSQNQRQRSLCFPSRYGPFLQKQPVSGGPRPLRDFLIATAFFAARNFLIDRNNCRELLYEQWQIKQAAFWAVYNWVQMNMGPDKAASLRSWIEEISTKSAKIHVEKAADLNLRWIVACIEAEMKMYKGLLQTFRSMEVKMSGTGYCAVVFVTAKGEKQLLYIVTKLMPVLYRAGFDYNGSEVFYNPNNGIVKYFLGNPVDDGQLEKALSEASSPFSSMLSVSEFNKLVEKSKPSRGSDFGLGVATFKMIENNKKWTGYVHVPEGGTWGENGHPSTKRQPFEPGNKIGHYVVGSVQLLNKDEKNYPQNVRQQLFCMNIQRCNCTMYCKSADSDEIKKVSDTKYSSRTLPDVGVKFVVQDKQYVMRKLVHLYFFAGAAEAHIYVDKVE